LFMGGDPFSEMLNLGGEVRQRDVTLRAQARRLEVADLPPGRPATFTGAVGSFQVSASLAAQAIRAGEPTTLTIRVKGDGSFARLTSDGLPSSDALKTYGVKTAFTRGTNPIAGEKVFTQTVVPTKAGDLTVPPVAVSYFDPQTRRYVTRRTMPITIAVGQASADTGEATAIPGRAAGAAPAAASPIADTVHATLTPLFRTSSYWWLVGGLLGGCALLAAWGWARSSPAFARAARSASSRRVIAARLREVDRAAAEGDAPALFVAARAAAQARLGDTWHMPPDAISAADIDARLGEKGARLRGVFEQADRLSYAGGTATPGKDLDRWRGVVLAELRTLEEAT
ncbi:MAG TPA: BatD family protein, partial [Polyangia bacterium]|nr:BatD family protein [Polyangia bacterium]